MAQVEVLMPKMGESVFEATVTKWLKKEGDTVALDESIVEIATDKVDSEIQSSAAGILIKCLFNEGDVVQVGKAIAVIDAEGAVSEYVVPAQETKSARTKEETAPTIVLAAEAIDKKKESVNVEDDTYLSPLVKNIIQKENISKEEIKQISGTGLHGRITKKDLLDYISNRKQGQLSVPTKLSEEPVTYLPNTAYQGSDEVIEMDRMRKLIADHMIKSKQTSAHVTSFVEADVTNLVRWREKHKDAFEKKEGEKLTFMPVFIQILAKVIKEFPLINSSVQGDKIIKHKNINIGMAAALPSGNLIVPVVKNADTLSLVGLTKKINDLASRSRTNQLLPDEVQGGTYTITNVGTFGNLMGTPIINQPQVAIMAIGVIKKKPAVIETELGDVIAIRHFIYLSHTYDHRIIDGSLGGQFVKRVSDLLEQWSPDYDL